MSTEAFIERAQQLDGVPKGARVVVAMSGGVDSSLCAALCARAGYDVVGMTLQLYDHGAAVKRSGACCAGSDIHDARRVAESLSIPHYVLDYESLFKETVIDDFADSYLAGATPVPCIRCNERVKFRDMLSTAQDLGADALVTGHYVRRRAGAQGAELLSAADPGRDQSYFLFTTTQAQLEFLRFPLGDAPNKDVVRDAATQFGLEVAQKPDSQDICFVPNGRYADVIERLRPDAAEAGDIVDMAGNIVGRHEGIIHYTVGQRRGLGISHEEPLYVVRLDAAKRRVVVGPREALGCDRFPVEEVNWLEHETPDRAGVPVMARVRSTRPPAPARVYGDQGRYWVELETPERGVAPGQACVFYDGERVLGGGWIARPESATMA
jgi:tRNA-specific 2-thiouridylase